MDYGQSSFDRAQDQDMYQADQDQIIRDTIRIRTPTDLLIKQIRHSFG